MEIQLENVSAKSCVNFWEDPRAPKRQVEDSPLLFPSCPEMCESLIFSNSQNSAEVLLHKKISILKKGKKVNLYRLIVTCLDSAVICVAAWCYQPASKSKGVKKNGASYGRPALLISMLEIFEKDAAPSKKYKGISENLHTTEVLFIMYRYLFTAQIFRGPVVGEKVVS